MTKAELLSTWCRLTGEQEREARHRIRVLSEAGQLPDRAQPMTAADLARFLIGRLASLSHKDAPDAVRRYSETTCRTFTAQTHDATHESPIKIGDTLLASLTHALASCWLVSEIQISVSAPNCTLILSRNGKYNPLGILTGETVVYTFLGEAVPELDFGHQTYPVDVTQRLHFTVIVPLARMLNDEPLLTLLKNNEAAPVGAGAASEEKPNATALAGGLSGAWQHPNDRDGKAVSQPRSESRRVSGRSKHRTQDPPWQKSASVPP